MYQSVRTLPADGLPRFSPVQSEAQDGRTGLWGTLVGRRVGLDMAEDDVVSEASELELREREEQERKPEA